MSRVELPTGAWCTLRPAAGTTERQRRPIRLTMARLSPGAKAAMDAVDDDHPLDQDALTPADIEVMYDINDLVAVALVDTASFLPDGARCTVDDILNLPGGDYDAVLEAVSPFIGAVMSGIDFDPTPDRDSPTSASSESGAR